MAKVSSLDFNAVNRRLHRLDILIDKAYNDGCLTASQRDRSHREIAKQRL